jgi:hypothetical protein
VIFRISCWFSADAEAVMTWPRRSRGPDVAVRGMPASTAAGRRAPPRLRSGPQRIADTDAGIPAYFRIPTQITLLRMPASAESLHRKNLHNGGSARCYQELSAPLASPTTAEQADGQAVFLCTGSAVRERPLVTPYARRCWMWRRPPDAVVGLDIPAHRGGRP